MEDQTAFIFTDRYGGHYPDTDTMCKGDCEGMGFVPVKAPATNSAYYNKWQEAEAKEHAEDGWHFVQCNDCNGTGKRMDTIGED
jgi:hypothetical protein